MKGNSSEKQKRQPFKLPFLLGYLDSNQDRQNQNL